MQQRDLLLALPPHIAANVLSRLDCLSVAAVLEAYEELRQHATLVTDHAHKPLFFTANGIKRHCLTQQELASGFGLLRALDAPLQLFEFAAHGYHRIAAETKAPHRKFIPLKHFGNRSYVYFSPPAVPELNHGDRIIAGNRSAVFLRRQGVKVFFDENPHSRLSLCSDPHGVKTISDVLEWQVFHSQHNSSDSPASPLSLTMGSPQSTTYTVASPLTEDGISVHPDFDGTDDTSNFTSFLDDNLCAFQSDSTSMVTFHNLQKLRLDRISNLQGLQHRQLEELVIFTNHSARSTPLFTDINCVSLKKFVVTYEKTLPSFYDLRLPQLETFELHDRRSLGDVSIPFTHSKMALIRMEDGYLGLDFLKTCTSITFGGTPDEILIWLELAVELKHFTWRRFSVSSKSSSASGVINLYGNLETVSIYNAVPFSALPSITTTPTGPSSSYSTHPLKTLSIINRAPGLSIKSIITSTGLERLQKFYLSVDIDPSVYQGECLYNVPEIPLFDIYNSFGSTIEEVYIYGCHNTTSNHDQKSITSICPNLHHMEIELQVIPERLMETFRSQLSQTAIKSLRNETFTEYIPSHIKQLWISQRPYIDDDNGSQCFHTGSISLDGITTLHETLTLTTGPCSFVSIIIPDSKQILVSKWTGEQATKGFNAWRRDPDKNKRFVRL